MGAAEEGEGEDGALPPLAHLGANWPEAGSPLSAPPRPPPRPPQASPPRRPRRPRRRRTRGRDGVTGLVLVAIVAAVALAVVQSGGQRDEPEAPGPTTDEAASGERSDRAAATRTVPSLGPPPAPPVGFAVGGEFVDTGSFIDGWATEVRPYAAATVQDLQVVAALYDGLTDVDPADPQRRPLGVVADRWEVAHSARSWRFHIRPGLTFSNGEPVLPSSFTRAWDLAAGPDNPSYSHLFGVIYGAAARAEGTAERLVGVTADDDALTLDVQLDAPLADFDALVSHPAFSPVPSAADDPRERTLAGNGPFVRGPDGEEGTTVLERNVGWDGRRYHPGLHLPDRPYLDRIVLVPHGRDGAHAYRQPTYREGFTPPPGLASTADQALFASYLLAFDMRHWLVKGEGNEHLRLAVMHAIDRERLVDEVFTGGRWRLADGLAPPSMPGYRTGNCGACTYDPDAARRHYAQWQAAGGEASQPLQVMHGETATERAAGERIVADLQAVGLPAEDVTLMATWYDASIDSGNCLICLQHWTADVPSGDALARAVLGEEARNRPPSGGYRASEVDDLLAEARRINDPAGRAAAYRAAEEAAMDSAQAIPLVWEQGDYSYDAARVAAFPLQPTGLVAWERVALKA